ncbi:MAG: efflux RND transporter periplasmic adaptor subunit [Steroidobacteraceae bacterium]
MTLKNRGLIGGMAIAVIAAAVGGFALSRCTSDTGRPTTQAPAKSAAEAPEQASTDRLDMTAIAIAAAGIVTETITSGGLGAEIVAQATVTPSATGQAIVTARTGGAVTRVFKRLGDPVRAGETLAIVESRDAAQIVAERSAAAAKEKLAEGSLARERYLFEQKVSARMDLEQAQAEAAYAAAEAQRANVAAVAANVTPDGRGVIVASPIAGRVTAASVTLGAFVQPETELFRVADPREIQIEASVGAADAARLQPGDRAVVELADGLTAGARVRAVTPTLSGESRTATAVLDASGAALQPGLAVRVRMMPRRGEASAGLVVPEEAVQSLNGRDVVFVRTPEGFRALPVTTGQRSAGRIAIVAGLSAGQTIAIRNAFLLKAELGKGSGEEE